MGKANHRPPGKGKGQANRGKNVITVERVQTGVRLEKRLLKVLKGLAEFHDLTLGDLLEGIVLHAFEGKCALSGNSLAKVRDLKKIYELDYGSEASHSMEERYDGT
jgi:hypothetical protein